jgi:hypothetical protein
MAPDEYTKALDKALTDLQTKIQGRDLVNAEIAGLKETVRVLSSRVELSAENQRRIAQMLAMADSATPKVTDAIRALLINVYPDEMTAIEVRDQLEDSSNFDDFSNSLSACHAALKRMLADGEVALGPPKNGKATYFYALEQTSYFEALGGLSSAANMLSTLLPNKPSQNAARDRAFGEFSPRALPPPNSKK